MTKIEQAVSFALSAHSGQKRKFKQIPSIFHLIETANIVAYYTNDEDVICAAILHDTLEDTKTTIDDLKNNFGDRVAKLVLSHTEIEVENATREASWLKRKSESLERLQKSSHEEKIIWLGDKLSNLRSFLVVYKEIGDDLFKKLNQKDKALHKLYYQKIIDVLKPEFENSNAFIELEKLYNIIFEQ